MVRACSMLRVNEGGPEESKRLVIPGQEAAIWSAQEGEGGRPGEGHGAEKGASLPRLLSSQ